MRMLAQPGGSFNGLPAATPPGYTNIAIATILGYRRGVWSVIICFITVSRRQVGRIAAQRFRVRNCLAARLDAL